MEKMFKQLLKQMKELTEQLQQQSEHLTELREIIAVKDAQIAALTARIEELTHKKNSGNSSKPPSSDRLSKPAPKSLRTKSGKSAGGQPGHKGSGMKIDREPDEIIEHRPTQCEGCPRAGTCKLRCCETRYEYEAIVETRLISHKVLGCKACVLTGKAVQGTFPAHHRVQAIRARSGRAGRVFADCWLHERGSRSEVAQEPANSHQQRQDPGHVEQSCEVG